MHDYVVTATAESLDLTEAEVQDALLTGSTLCQLALDNGITAEDLPTFLQGVHETALDQAVIDGVITEAQAELMKERMLLRGTGFGVGARGGHGMMGSGSCLRNPNHPVEKHGIQKCPNELVGAFLFCCSHIMKL